MKEDQENQETQTNAGFTFAPGTVLMLGEEKITVTENSTVHFDGADNEPRVVGMLSNSRNLDANRENLKGNYNGFGMEILPAPAQPETGQSAVQSAAPVADNLAAAASMSDEEIQKRIDEGVAAGLNTIREEFQKNLSGTNGTASNANGDANAEAQEQISVRGETDPTSGQFVAVKESILPSEAQIRKDSIEQPQAADEETSVAEQEKASAEGEPQAEVEDLATEAHVRADLKAKTVKEQRQIAKDLGIALPSRASEDRIIDEIVKNVGTREAMEKILASDEK